MGNKNLLSFFKRCTFSDEEQRLLDGAFASKVEVNQEHRMIKAHAEFLSYVPFCDIQKYARYIPKGIYN